MHAKYLPFPSLADTERAGEDSLGLLAEGGPDSRTLSAIFFLEELKIKRFRSTEGKCNPPPPLFASPSPFKQPFWSFPHRSGGTVGERGTAVLSSFSSPLSFLFLCRYQSPSPVGDFVSSQIWAAAAAGGGGGGRGGKVESAKKASVRPSDNLM